MVYSLVLFIYRLFCFSWDNRAFSCVCYLKNQTKTKYSNCSVELVSPISDADAAVHVLVDMAEPGVRETD